jgi:predicted ester cyclase
MPDLVGELIRVVVDGSIAVMEIRWRATHTGAMPLPSGELPPSGRNIDALGTTWQTWRDGKLVAERNHLDMLAMLTQHGVLPS